MSMQRFRAAWASEEQTKVSASVGADYDVGLSRLVEKTGTRRKKQRRKCMPGTWRHQFCETRK
jgi:hypothetical protein